MMFLVIHTCVKPFHELDSTKKTLVSHQYYIAHHWHTFKSFCSWTIWKPGMLSVYFSLPTTKNTQQWVTFGALLSPDSCSLWKKEVKKKIVIQEIINRYCAEGYHYIVTTNLSPIHSRYICFPCLGNLGHRTMSDFTKKPRLQKRKKKMNVLLKKNWGQWSWHIQKGNQNRKPHYPTKLIYASDCFSSDLLWKRSSIVKAEQKIKGKGKHST